MGGTNDKGLIILVLDKDFVFYLLEETLRFNNKHKCEKPFFIFYFILLFCFLGLHLWHMEILRIGVKLEL